MRSVKVHQGLVNVSGLAKLAGCNFEVAFSQKLWAWCQSSPGGPGLWNKEGGILCSLSCRDLPAEGCDELATVKTAGQKIMVRLRWSSDGECSSRFVVSLRVDNCERRRIENKRLLDRAKVTPIPIESRPEAPWYFVCLACDAKWFAESSRARCPRCSDSNTSTEQITPPWWR
jgi:hypothetical protein